jgi:hypothetical protein
MSRFLTILIVLLQLSLVFPAFGNANNKVLVHKQSWIQKSGKYSYVENYKIRKPSERKNNVLPKQNWNFKSPGLFKGGSWMVYIIWIIIIGALVALFIVIALRIYKESNEKIKNKKILSPDDIDNIEDADLNNPLQYYEANKMYKEALRFKYLILLKDLHLAKFIIWKKEKTNGAYMEELYNRQCFEKFKFITLIFEKVWYGDKRFGENEYKLLVPLFGEIKQILPVTLVTDKNS